MTDIQGRILELRPLAGAARQVVGRRFSFTEYEILRPKLRPDLCVLSYARAQARVPF